MNFLFEPWPWYVAGPMIGLIVPLLLLLTNKQFGISSSMRHFCASCLNVKAPFFQYDWRKESWNLVFVVGVIAGGVLAHQYLGAAGPVDISPDTKQALRQHGINNFNQILPANIFTWEALTSIRGMIIIVLGGFMVGFGARYAGGCTSGHAIMGLSYFQWPSLIAVLGFFAGGLLMTHFLLPWILSI